MVFSATTGGLSVKYVLYCVLFIIPHYVPHPLCSLHLCHGQRLKGYEFCIKHILEDKAAPYRPCAYTVDTGHSSHQCPRAAPRSSRGEVS